MSFADELKNIPKRDLDKEKHDKALEVTRYLSESFYEGFKDECKQRAQLGIRELRYNTSRFVEALRKGVVCPAAQKHSNEIQEAFVVFDDRTPDGYEDRFFYGILSEEQAECFKDCIEKSLQSDGFVDYKIWRHEETPIYREDCVFAEYGSGEKILAGLLGCSSDGYYKKKKTVIARRYILCVELKW